MVSYPYTVALIIIIKVLSTLKALLLSSDCSHSFSSLFNKAYVCLMISLLFDFYWFEFLSVQGFKCF